MSLRKRQLAEWAERVIDDERTRQTVKWGVQDHPPFAWLAILTEEVGELAQAMSEEHWRNGPREDVLSEAVHVAAVARQIVEAIIEGRCRKEGQSNADQA